MGAIFKCPIIMPFLYIATRIIIYCQLTIGSALESKKNEQQQSNDIFYFSMIGKLYISYSNINDFLCSLPQFSSLIY